MAKENRHFRTDKGEKKEFKTSKGGKFEFDLTKDSAEAVPDSQQPAPGLQESADSGKNTNRKVLKWCLIGLGLIIALVILCICLPSDDDSDGDPYIGEYFADSDSMAVDSDSVVVADFECDTQAISGEEAPAEAEIENTPAEQPANQPANQANQAASSQPAKASQGGVVAPTGDVLTEAEKVIRGDYGSGEVRREKLGSSYGAIQAEVNRMKREGKF